MCPVPDVPVPLDLDPNDLLPSRAVAVRMGFTKTDRFLEQIRRPTDEWARTFPRPVKIGRQLLFRRGDVDRWITETFDAAQAQS